MLTVCQPCVAVTARHHVHGRANRYDRADALSGPVGGGADGVNEFANKRDITFQEYALPRSRLKWCGETIDPSAIRRTMLLTVEGERDDICAVGQTVAAHDL